jgi:hypothetical protein
MCSFGQLLFKKRLRPKDHDSLANPSARGMPKRVPVETVATA